VACVLPPVGVEEDFQAESWNKVKTLYRE